MTSELSLHPGPLLRLLRLDSGLGLRDLARRIDVSGAYLSRVENALDATPTVARLEALARELSVPAELLLDLAPRISPLVLDYVEQVPEAATLFLEIAHRQLDSAAIHRLRQSVLAESAPRAARAIAPWRLADLLTPSRVVLDLSCADLEDAFDVAAQRLETTDQASFADIATQLLTREQSVSSAIGGGVALPVASWAHLEPQAVLVTLSPPLRIDTPDHAPLRTLVLLAGPRHDEARRVTIVHCARLAARGLADALESCDTVQAALSSLARLEQRVT